MARTAPRTWIPYELVTAALFNEQIRDNDLASWVGTTAGDLDYYTSSTTKDRIGIGSDYDVLTVAASAPVWAGYSSCRLKRSTAQTISHNTVTRITGWTSEEWDTDAYHAGTDAYVTIPVTGLYMIVANGYWASVTGNTARELSIFAGSTAIGVSAILSAANYSMAQNVYALDYITATTQVSLFVKQLSGSNLGFDDTIFTIARIK